MKFVINSFNWNIKYIQLARPKSHQEDHYGRDFRNSDNFFFKQESNKQTKRHSRKVFTQNI